VKECPHFLDPNVSVTNSQEPSIYIPALNQSPVLLFFPFYRMSIYSYSSNYAYSQKSVFRIVATLWAECSKNRGWIPSWDNAPRPIFEALPTNLINRYRDRLTGWSVYEVSNNENFYTFIVNKVHINFLAPDFLFYFSTPCI